MTVRVGVVVAIVLAAAASLNYVVANRLIENNKNVSLLEARLAQCEAALAANNTEAAIVHLANAEPLMNKYGGHQSSKSIPLVSLYHKYMKEAAILRELDHAGEVRWQLHDGRYQRSESAGRLRAVFARLEIIPGRTSPDTAKQIIEDAVIRERLSAEMHWWLVTEREDLKARESIREMLEKIDPSEFRTAIRRAFRGETQEAELAGLLTLGEFKFNNEPAWFVAAIGIVNLGDDSDVQARALKTVIGRSPNDFAALMSLGRLTGPAPQDTALLRAQCCRAALALRPKHAAAWHNLGVALRDMRDYGGAVESFDRALEIDPSYTAAKINKGAAQLDMGCWADAIVTYTRAIDPANPSVHPHDGVLQACLNGMMALGEAGRHTPEWCELRETAKWHYSEADRVAAEIARVPGGQPTRPWGLYADYWWLCCGDLDKAATYYRALVKECRMCPSGYIELGRALERRDKRKAAEHYQALIDLVSKCPDGYVGLGGLFEKAKQWREAIEQYNKAITESSLKNDLYREAMYRKWKCFEKLEGNAGRMKAAEAAYRQAKQIGRGDQKAIANSSDRCRAYLELGSSLEKDGNWLGAIDQYNRLIVTLSQSNDLYREIAYKEWVCFAKLLNQELPENQRHAVAKAYLQALRLGRCDGDDDLERAWME